MTAREAQRMHMLDHRTKVNIVTVEPHDSDVFGAGTVYRVRYHLDAGGGDGPAMESIVRAVWPCDAVELDVEDLTLGSFSPRDIINTVGRRESARIGREWRDVV
jgi:hypothetical protein